jgi:EAL domain-containing protein (putative c-di-GMP-specific phosphodiesterase class I)/CHASE2 domain-containing sensor protein
MPLGSQIYAIIGKIGPYTLAIVFALVATFGLVLAGVAPGIEQTNRDLRSAIFERNASGKVAVVEMDSQSLKKIGSWPWSRDIHSKLVQELSRKGAAQVAFDIDFSASSDAGADQRLADTIARTDIPVILATFRQRSSSLSNRYIENLPLKSLRSNALLASVNVHPDELGQVSYYSNGTKIGGKPRPTLAALLTDSNGQIGEGFLLDQAINLRSIPSFSAIDVINGEVDRREIEGRSFIIGASAIELGDNYATPHAGVIPGVFIHALAAETFLAGHNLPTLNGVAVLVLMIVLAVFWWRLMANAKSGHNRLILPLFAGILIAGNWALYTFAIAELEISLSIIFAGCLYIAVWIIQMLRTMKRERHTDLETGLPNSNAMKLQAKKYSDVRLAVVQIANFSEIESLLDPDKQFLLISSLANRYSLLAQDEQIFRTSRDQLAWFISEEYADRLDEHFETAASFSNAPAIIEGQRMRLSTHLGYNEGVSDNWSKLIGDASVAAHKAAELNYRWMKFSQGLNEIISEKLAILNDIDHAMSAGDIWVAYQPKLDMHNDEINAAEALVRWNHPVRGIIGPDRFIPVLEDQGRIADLTLHVLKTALKDTNNWARSGLIINCSVNVSAALLTDEKFVSLAMGLVQRSDVPADQISFEITETAALGDLDRAKAVLQAIREIGVKLSIDDYGTGQSNLSYMQGFPADEIKIDQSFIKSMVNRDVDRVMVSSTIEMAHKMNFKVVAEGVEDLDCLLLLKKFGCDVAQGWHIGKPIDAVSFLQQWSGQASKNIA